MTEKKSRDVLLVLIMLFLLFLFFSTLIVPNIFDNDPLLQGIFGWSCTIENEFTGVLCQIMFGIKFIVVAYLIINLVYFLWKKLPH